MAASQTKVVRERKDGGYSPCSATEENVGKRRCAHVHGGTSFKVEINKLGPKLEEIVISEDYEKLEKRDKEEIVKKFISTLEPIDQKTLNRVLADLHREN